MPLDSSHSLMQNSNGYGSVRSNQNIYTSPPQHAEYGVMHTSNPNPYPSLSQPLTVKTDFNPPVHYQRNLNHVLKVPTVPYQQACKSIVAIEFFLS